MIAILVTCLLGMESGGPGALPQGTGLFRMGPAQEVPSDGTTPVPVRISQDPAPGNASRTARTLENQYQARQAMSGDLEDFRGGSLGFVALIVVVVVVVVFLLLIL